MLGRENRLTDSNDFQSVFKLGQSFANRNLVLYYKKRTSEDPLRLGLSVSKKIGNSVVRNRVRRLMREAFRTLLLARASDLAGYDFILIARTPIVELGLEEMSQNMVHIFQKSGLLSPARKHTSSMTATNSTKTIVTKEGQ